MPWLGYYFAIGFVLVLIAVWGEYGAYRRALEFKAALFIFLVWPLLLARLAWTHTRRKHG